MSNGKCKSVNFEIVEVWENDCYTPYTLQPEDERSRKNYAIKIEHDFFLLGETGPFGNSLYISDYEYPAEYKGG